MAILIEYFNCMHLEKVIVATIIEIAIFLKNYHNYGDSSVGTH